MLPMINKRTISLIIPCRNEAKVLPGLISRLPSYINQIIVVDNNSTDNTSKVAKLAGAQVFKEKRTKNGIGYGYAHQIGLQKATGDYIFALDGDDTYPTSHIKKIVKFMEQKQLDFVSCNRLPLKTKNAISKTRKLGIQVLNLEALLLFNFPIKDILSGMWGLKRHAVNKLNLKEGGWDLSPEIKLNAFLHPNINFGEYHIPHFNRDDSAVSKQKIWQTGAKHAFYLLKRRINAILKYDQNLANNALLLPSQRR